MIYENEELRLRTININAEIERGQYDIKKLKRENELLKKEIWCLRDEYEKLDKLLKDKEIDVSSSSTTSESDSCSSCMDECDDVENSQNLENVHKSNVNCLNRAFETLSVVPEESTENSENTSNRTSLVNEQLPHDNDVIQADQSYPSYDQAPTLRLTDAQSNSPKQFFSLDRLVPNTTVAYHEGSIYPNELYGDNAIGNKSTCESQETTIQCTSKKLVHTEANSIYQNIVLVPKKAYLESETMEKSGTDIIVKTDNRNFHQDDKPNGDGYIAHFSDDFPRYWANFGTNSRSTFSNGGNLEELLNDIETISQDILAISNSNQNDYFNSNRRCKSDINPTDNQGNSGKDKPFKSELNVTLMPQPMTLIGLEKYRDIQRSMNSTPSKSLENLTAQGMHVVHSQDDQFVDKREFHHFQQSPNEVPDFIPISPNPISNFTTDTPSTKIINPDFTDYFSNVKDNYVNGDYFARYNPDSFQIGEKLPNNVKNSPKAKDHDVRHEKVRNLVKQVSIDMPSSENDEKAKTKTESESLCITSAQKVEKDEKPKEKLGLRKKVSIHFRGKKEKQKKAAELPSTSIKKQSPVRDKKIQEVETEESKNDKLKISLQKTCSKDSNKTTSESDTKNNGENRKHNDSSDNDKKMRKSQSVSPDRRKFKDDKKCKKHKRDRLRVRRTTVTSLDSRDQRGRSHSVNTDRSNQFFYDEYMLNSERDSMSSCETLKTRQMNFTNISIAGKVPWCGCWGNGCI
ncbi:hypothetical protein WA026_011909 [Henosepilachna vigintioctopunctata]